MASLNKIFSCKYKGIELNCMQGNILMAGTDCIAIICDPDCKLNSGIGRAIREAAGPQFMPDVQRARISQRNDRAIAVRITAGVRADYALLAPVHGMDRRSLDQIYIAIIHKAVELRAESMTMPLLGTGGLDLSFRAAANFMRTAMCYFDNFGDRFKKLNFIDSNEGLMRELRGYIIENMMNQPRPSNGTSQQSHQLDSSFRALGSGTSTSPVQLFQRPSGTNGNEPTTSAQGSSSFAAAADVPGPSTGRRAAAPQQNRNRGPRRININVTMELDSSDSDSTYVLDGDSRTTPNSNGYPLTRRRTGTPIPGVFDTDQESSSSNSSNMEDEDMALAQSLSDVMDSDDSLEAISQARHENATINGTDTDDDDSDDDDVLPDMDDDVEPPGGGAKYKLSREQEARFWTVVTSDQLRESSSQKQSENDENKPSTSSRLASGRTSIGNIIGSQNSTQYIDMTQQQSSSSASSQRHPNVKLDDSTLPCSICLTDMREGEAEGDVVVQLSLCSHMYHVDCIRNAFRVKPQCPLCMLWYGEFIGYQPADATMKVQNISGKVPGHRDAKGFIQITYHIPAGIQTEGHIRPGESYRSATRVAYLPNNAEGNRVLKLLQLAFKRRLIFTIGDSVTTGRKNVPVWNNIHHKTNKEGGPQCYGYPDPTYFDRVKEELAMVGVRSDQLG